MFEEVGRPGDRRGAPGVRACTFTPTPLPCSCMHPCVGGLLTG